MPAVRDIPIFILRKKSQHLVMAYDITLEGKNGKEAEALLEKGASLLEASGITYWLEGGTLLGIRREDRLLPWDNDIDISLMEDQLAAVEPFLSSVKKAGLRVRVRRFPADSLPFRKGDIRMIKIRKSHFFGLLKGKVCLDIFVKYESGDKAFWMIAEKTKAVPVSFYRNFRNIQFKGRDYSIPRDTEAYLSYRYGDWETPVQDWDTARDDKALT